MPGTGCNVELTRIRDDEDMVWWSIGFEAWGEFAFVEDALRSTVDVMLERMPPHLPVGYNASYPKWLAHELRKKDDFEKLEAIAPHAHSR